MYRFRICSISYGLSENDWKIQSDCRIERMLYMYFVGKFPQNPKKWVRIPAKVKTAFFLAKFENITNILLQFYGLLSGKCMFTTAVDSENAILLHNSCWKSSHV